MPSVLSMVVVADSVFTVPYEIDESVSSIDLWHSVYWTHVPLLATTVVHEDFCLGHLDIES